MACKKRKNPQKISAVRSGGGNWIWLDNEISPDSYGEFFEEIEISHVWAGVFYRLNAMSLLK